MNANVPIPPFQVPESRSVRVTKESLGVQTRKSILYPDQHFFSSVFKGKDPRWSTAMQRITEFLDFQLLAVPHPSTHEPQTDLYTRRRDELLNFIQTLTHGQHFN